MKKILLLIALGALFSCNSEKSSTKNIDELSSREKVDSTQIKHLFNAALTQGKSYEWLRDLTKNIGGRLSGSPEAQKAVEWGEKIMNEVGLDSVWLQPVMIPKWVRGAPEYAHIESSPGNTISVPIAELGGSISTPSIGISANVL